jgi:elongation factor 2
MKLTERVLPLFQTPGQIRNIAIVAHIDHGKTSFSDSLLAASGLLSRDLAGKALMLDSRDDERERGITIDSALASLLYESPTGSSYLINLVDTPGHIDFGGDVSRAMRAVDGCIVLVCAVEGVMPQTETVLRQALRERVRPVLFINKVDRLIKELQLTTDQIQQRIEIIIREVNMLIRHYSENKEWEVSVQNGSVCIGSSLHGWALSARVIADAKISFKDVIESYLQDSSVAVSRDELSGTNQGASDKLPDTPMPGVRSLRSRCSLQQAVFQMVIDHIPTPDSAQVYRIPCFWHGDVNSPLGNALSQCRVDGEFCFVVTKIEVDKHQGEICVGRIFSGKARAGMDVLLCRTKEAHKLRQCYAEYGPKRDIIPGASAGSLISITGIDGARAGDTITEQTITQFDQLRTLFDPVLTKSIESRRPQDMARLREVLMRNVAEDPSLQLSVNDQTGELLLSGMGELHLEVVENRIRDIDGIQVIAGDPIVLYREGIASSEGIAQGQKQDRAPHVLPSASIQMDGVSRAVKFVFSAKSIIQGRNQDRQNLQHSSDDSANVQGTEAANLLELGSILEGKKRESEIKNLITGCFDQAMRAGPLCREQCLGISITLVDIIDPDSELESIRDLPSLAPMVRNAIRDAIRIAGPILLEPVETLQFELPASYVGEITQLIAAKRGDVEDMKQTEMRMTLRAKLAVSQMIGLASDVRSVSEGKASFSVMAQDFMPVPLDQQDEIIRRVRRRKGLQYL